ncbi:MAG TPA: hypothetical protein VJ912_02475, partial [Candidatus Nanoarchaeia archaeon]|nr:hypothetical protein [Candidatus Nanoarchaeia archaeon]
FNKKNKYDEAPLETHLNWNEDLFGYEKGFYRFREGKRKETEKQVRDYFDTENLRAFKEFGEFVKPYVNKLDRPHTINF